MSPIIPFALICGVLGVAYALITAAWVSKQDSGTERMRQISDAVKEGVTQRPLSHVANTPAGRKKSGAGLTPLTGVCSFFPAKGDPLWRPGRNSRPCER